MERHACCLVMAVERNTLLKSQLQAATHLRLVRSQRTVVDWPPARRARPMPCCWEAGGTLAVVTLLRKILILAIVPVDPVTQGLTVLRMVRRRRAIGGFRFARFEA